jgi:hypothetical protein
MDQNKMPIGDTRVIDGAQPYRPIDPLYRGHYQQLVCDSNTHIWSGPSLVRQLDFNRRELTWYDRYGHENPWTDIDGSLAHADQPNERLVLVQLGAAHGNDLYLFAYTGSPTTRRQRPSVELNEMRRIIDLFFSHYVSGAQLSNVPLALNLDGGGSIYLSWNNGAREEVIAKGRYGADDPDGRPLGHVRDVANLLKFTAR